MIYRISYRNQHSASPGNHRLAGFFDGTAGFCGTVVGFRGAVAGFDAGAAGFTGTTAGFIRRVAGFCGAVAGFCGTTVGFYGTVAGFCGAVAGFKDCTAPTDDAPVRIKSGAGPCSRRVACPRSRRLQPASAQPASAERTLRVERTLKVERTHKGCGYTRVRRKAVPGNGAPVTRGHTEFSQTNGPIPQT
ncbi:MAG: hypothetical protein PCFJNLEI_04087 [Verrucomicrobiae bacterium]|nr:hypothetical protein [Verrucomicrobiae bacterium]